jgi:hypothetical protein
MFSRFGIVTLALLATVFVTVQPVCAQDGVPSPVSRLFAADVENDSGEAIIVTWDLSPNDPSSTPAPDLTIDASVRVTSYVIARRKAEDATEWKVLGEETYGSSQFLDQNVHPGQSFFYRVQASADGVLSAAVETDEFATAEIQYFNWAKIWLLIWGLVIGSFIVTYIMVAQSGRPLKVREIAGLEAVDEAVGRATEMGRPVLFISGILDINDIQTLAGITVLSRVARTAAEYGATLEMPTCRALVMTAARETVQEAFLAAGRPEAYQEDRIYYLTDEQFGFVAGVTGMMVRDKPAACIYMGAFYAESLILAETGNHIGAIQVAGTAMPSQLPFFVAACDYTLIGEEFFAASAYLSGDPKQLGSLKGQDAGKLLSGILMIIGVVLMTIQAVSGSGWVLESILNYITNHILGNGGFIAIIVSIFGGAA